MPKCSPVPQCTHLPHASFIILYFEFESEGIFECLSEINFLAYNFLTKLTTKWFKYDRDYLCVNLATSVPVIFEPPCILPSKTKYMYINTMQCQCRTYTRHNISVHSRVHAYIVNVEQSRYRPGVGQRVPGS